MNEAFEYAIQLGDGTMSTGWDEYCGQIVQTWTDRAVALDELNRIKCAGLSLRPGGGIDRDPILCSARLVRRPALAWEVEPEVPAERVA